MAGYMTLGFSVGKRNELNFQTVSTASLEAIASTTLAETTTLTETTKETTTKILTTKKETTTQKVEKTTKPTTIKVKTETAKAADGNFYEVPNVPDFKSWTNYVKCVSRSSAQWEFLNSEGTWTDENGFRRKDNDYMVAMGSYYTQTLGDRFRITTVDGNEFTVVICDWKSDRHTDSKHQYTVANNCVIEFYVDDNLSSKVRQSGSASSIPELSGKISTIEKI